MRMCSKFTLRKKNQDPSGMCKYGAFVLKFGTQRKKKCNKIYDCDATLSMLHATICFKFKKGEVISFLESIACSNIQFKYFETYIRWWMSTHQNQHPQLVTRSEITRSTNITIPAMCHILTTSNILSNMKKKQKQKHDGKTSSLSRLSSSWIHLAPDLRSLSQT